MNNKLDLDLAIYGGDCPRCNERHPLFIPLIDKDWNYLCEDCMNELGLEVDIEATRKDLG